MKAIIQGKRYDTEKATEVAHFWNGLAASDFGNISETLYLTAKGSWFLHGKGGACSPYSEPCEGGRCRTGGEKIVALTQDEAWHWLEDHHEIEALEKYFANCIEEA